MFEQKIESRKIQHEQDFSHGKTLDEQIFYVTHNIHNRKQKNGRINRFNTETGQYSANSVSPFAENFESNNIEPKIQPVVSALLSRGYYTYSSCAGHCLSDRRFVGIAFPNLMLKIRFLAQMSHLRGMGVSFRELESVVNQKSAITATGLETIPYGEAGQRYVSLEEETHVFNIQFHEEAERFYFVEMIILEGADTCSGLQNPYGLRSFGLQS
jgi:hypothetical protein